MQLVTITSLTNPDALKSMAEVYKWANVRRAGTGQINITKLAGNLKPNKIQPYQASQINQYLDTISNAELNIEETLLDLESYLRTEKFTKGGTEVSSLLEEAFKVTARSEITHIRKNELEPTFARALVGDENIKFRLGASGSREPDIIIEPPGGNRRTIELKLLEPVLLKELRKKRIALGGLTISNQNAAEIYANNFEKKSTNYIFGYLKKYQKDLYQEVKDKSRAMVVTIPILSSDKQRITSYPTTFLFFQGENYLNQNNFHIVHSFNNPAISITPYLSNTVTQKVIKDMQTLMTKEHDNYLGQTLKDMDEYLGQINQKKIETTNLKRTSNLNSRIQAFILGSNKPEMSIPLGTVRAVPRRKSSAFTSRRTPARSILRETRKEVDSIGEFVTDEQITALVKREMMRRMPIGPVGGSPLSSRVLTFRTGRFVNSTKIFADHRRKQMQYFYNPIYWVHERTSRDPRSLINSSISSVALALFKKRYSVVKMDREET